MDKEYEDAMNGMREWRYANGDDNPSEDTVNDMMMQDFYERVMSFDSHSAHVDALTRTIHSQLHELQDYQNRNLVAVFPPANEDITNVYHHLAVNMDEFSYQFDTYNYMDNVDGDLSAYRQNAVNDIYHNLVAGELDGYVAYLDEVVNEASDELSDDLSDYVNQPELLDFDKIIQMRIETNTRFTGRDVDIINDKIVNTLHDLSNKYDEAMALADATLYSTDIHLSDRNYGTKEVPYYDSFDNPDVMLNNSLLMQDAADLNHSNSLLDLYERVYSLERTDWNNVSVEVVGRERDSSKSKPYVLKQSTLDELGDDYSSFRKSKFDQSLKSYQDEFVTMVNKPSGLSGIDFSKAATTVDSAVRSPMVNKDVVTHKPTSLKSEKSTVRAMPTVYNTAEHGNDWSFDEHDV